MGVNVTPLPLPHMARIGRNKRGFETKGISKGLGLGGFGIYMYQVPRCGLMAGNLLFVDLKD